MIMEKKSAVVMIETLDGRSFVGATLKECIQRMRASAWACAEDSLRAYMVGVAERVMLWNKQPIRVDNVETFVHDMEQAGVLIVRTAQ
jgi:hypothetical protein